MIASQDCWFYAEWSKSFGWVSAWANSGYDRATILRMMEARKKAAPRARLRLVHEIRTITPYRNRNKAT